MYFNPTSGISNFNPYSLKHNIIFPNPNYGSFFFQSSEQSTFKLLNAAGQVIDKIVTKTSDLNCYTFSNLKPGIYFLVSPKLIYKSEKIIVLEK